MKTQDDPPVYDRFAASLTTADDRILLNYWLPPQSGIVPVIRLRTRWYSVLWALPIGRVWVPALAAGQAPPQPFLRGVHHPSQSENSGRSAPALLATGLHARQSPALSNHLGWFGRLLNRQRARSIHFLALWWFLLFILAHVTLVFITGARVNLNMMWAGRT